MRDYNLSETLPPDVSLPTRNYYHALSMDDDEGPDDRRIAVDSGASANFGDADTPGTERLFTPTGVVMASATGDRKTLIGVDRFDLPLPPTSLDYHVFNRGEVQRPLLSVGKVCDAGCMVLFMRHGCYFVKDRKVLLYGRRDPQNGLYLLPHSSKDCRLERAYNLTTPYRNRTSDPYTMPNLMRFLHGCAGFPVTSTWMEAIRLGYYMGWPGLTASRVRKYLPKSEETALGHLKMVRQGTRSTNSKGVECTVRVPLKHLEYASERKTSRNTGRRRNVMVGSVPMKELRGIVGTDQTGRFPVTSD